MRIVDFDIPATASPNVGAPPQGGVAFYWHFIRQTKGWYAAMFAASLTVALLDTVIPIFIGRLVALMGAPDRPAGPGGGPPPDVGAPSRGNVEVDDLHGRMSARLTPLAVTQGNADGLPAEAR